MLSGSESKRNANNSSPLPLIEDRQARTQDILNVFKFSISPILWIKNSFLRLCQLSLFSCALWMFSTAKHAVLWTVCPPLWIRLITECLLRIPVLLLQRIYGYASYSTLLVCGTISDSYRPILWWLSTQRNSGNRVHLHPYTKQNTAGGNGSSQVCACFWTGAESRRPVSDFLARKGAQDTIGDALLSLPPAGPNTPPPFSSTFLLPW